jgi:DNA-binding transcriptional LysR family regulator
MRGIGLPPGAIRIALELPSNEALLAAVTGGDLVTAVSDLAAAPHVAAGRVCRLDFLFPDRAFDLITHADRHASYAATAFRALL